MQRGVRSLVLRSTRQEVGIEVSRFFPRGAEEDQGEQGGTEVDQGGLMRNQGAPRGLRGDRGGPSGARGG